VRATKRKGPAKEPCASRKESRTAAQRAYLDITAVEDELTKVLDGTPFSVLRSKKTHRQIVLAMGNLKSAIYLLSEVRDEWAPIYERSEEARS